MNRRTYLKGLFAVGIVGGVSFSFIKWFEIKQKISPDQLWSKSGLIAELAELIIPSTSTPGAKDAGVDKYIINVLLNCTPLNEQHKFLWGIEELEKYAMNNYGTEFIKCSFTQKNEILQRFYQNAEFSNRIVRKISRKFFGESFFSKLKELTVEGYCLSEAGAKKGLAYDYIPGKYLPCIPLSLNQKSWATK